MAEKIKTSVPEGEHFWLERGFASCQVLLTPEEYLTDHHTMLPGNEGARYTRFKVLLNNCDLFLYGYTIYISPVLSHQSSVL